MKRKPEEYLFTALVGGFYIYAVTYAVITTTVIPFDKMSLYLTGLFMLLGCMLVFYNRYTLLAFAGLLAVAGVYIWLTRENRQPQFDFIAELLQLARGMLAYRDEYGTTVIRLLCFAVSLFAALCLYARFYFWPLALGGASIFIINRIMEYRSNETAFYIFLCCLCVLCIKKMNHALDKHARNSFAALTALPLCALALAVAFLIPGENPADSDWSRLLEDPVASVNDFFYTAFNPKYYSFQTTGFTGVNNRLGGPVSVSHREVMRVDAPNRAYLSGASKNTYTGNTWIDTLKDGDLLPEGADINRTEFLETAAALVRYTTFWRDGWGSLSSDLRFLNEIYPPADWTQLNDDMFPYLRQSLNQGLNRYVYTYLPIKTLRVDIGENRIGSLFRPPKFARLTMEGNEDSGTDNAAVAKTIAPEASPAGDLSTAGLLPKNTAYAYEYLDINTQLTFMQAMMNLSHRGAYAEIVAQTADGDFNAAANFDEIIDAYALTDNANPTPDAVNQLISALLAYIGELVEYADGVYAHYTDLPETLPRRVYDLAADIVRDCETDYERVIAIEAYLAQIPYTLSPAPVPEDTDFVDYFLFENREGYCTYYASAMAVLCRCIGIPSRYMEGYLLPPSPETSSSGEKTYVVTNRQAHSWAEVYLEGYGWLTVEATAPYRYATQSSTPVSAEVFTPVFQEDERYIEHLQDIGFDPARYGLPSSTTQSTAAATEKPANRTVYVNPALAALRSFLAGMLMIATCVLCVLLFLAVQRLREMFRLFRVGRMDANMQAQVYFHGLMKMTTYYHFPFQNGETPRAYGRRVGKRFAFASDTVFLRDLVTLYYKARYGASDIGADELTMMRDCYFEMIAFLRHVRFWPHYMYLRFVRRVTLL